jgi:hypothetical protein
MGAGAFSQRRRGLSSKRAGEESVMVAGWFAWKRKAASSRAILNNVKAQ